MIVSKQLYRTKLNNYAMLWYFSVKEVTQDCEFFSIQAVRCKMLSRKIFQRKNFERVKCKGNYSPLDCAFIFTKALNVTRKARVKKLAC